MTRTVVVIRHAHAGNHSAPDDHERPLDGRGHREAADAGRWLAAGWLASTQQRLGVVLVSSAVRTRQTWELLSSQLADAPEATIEPRVYDCDLDDLLDLLEEHTDTTTVAIVGHNPAVSALASQLVDQNLTLSPAAVAIVDVSGEDEDGGRLIASWSPHRH